MPEFLWLWCSIPFSIEGCGFGKYGEDAIWSSNLCVAWYNSYSVEIYLKWILFAVKREKYMFTYHVEKQL